MPAWVVPVSGKEKDTTAFSHALGIVEKPKEAKFFELKLSRQTFEYKFQYLVGTKYETITTTVTIPFLTIVV